MARLAQQPIATRQASLRHGAYAQQGKCALPVIATGKALDTDTVSGHASEEAWQIVQLTDD